jgi:hypothetical protein
MSNFSPYSFIELFVVLAFLGAWAILEYVGKRLDARRDREARKSEDGASEVRSAGEVGGKPNEISCPRSKH